MNIPINNNNRFTLTRNQILLSEKPNIKSEIFWGICWLAINHEKIFAVAIINITVDAIVAALSIITGRSLNFISLYIKSEINRPAITATEAASVGVKIPPTIPPTIITGNVRAGIALIKVLIR